MDDRPLTDNIRPRTAVAPKSNTKTFVGRPWWHLVLGGVVAIILIFFIQNYISTRNQLKKLTGGSAANKASDQELIKQVGAVVVLPEGETPTVATVSDVSKLKDQVFFANAQNGDRVLIFTNAKTAILYRPSSKKIVEYAPVNVGANAADVNGIQAPKK